MSKMKMILSLVVLCLVLDNGLGAPTGRYMFLRCNPSQGYANCVKHRSPEMELSPDLPARLPAAAADYIEAEPVEEDEGPVTETQMTEPWEGSGGFEGSSDGYPYPWMADKAPEAGSGGSLTVNESEPNQAMPALMPAAQELREENLLL